jgi:hypothetical protein
LSSRALWEPKRLSLSPPRNKQHRRPHPRHSFQRIHLENHAMPIEGAEGVGREGAVEGEGEAAIMATFVRTSRRRS